ncbi:HflK protein, partial [bacterium K02(2017)]
KVDLVNRATCKATRFTTLYKEYKKAPIITKKRLYFEQMKIILANAEKIYIVDTDVKGILPMLKLGGSQ